MDIGRQVLRGQRGIKIEVTNRKISHGSQDSLGQEKQRSRVGGQPSSRGQVIVCRWAVGGTPGVIWMANWTLAPDQETRKQGGGSQSEHKEGALQEN